MFKKLHFFVLLVGITSSSLFAQIPTGYYDSATGTGYTLKTQLYNIIKGQTDLGYNGLWTTYQTSDRDNFYENDGTILDMYSENPAGVDYYTFTYSTDQCGTYSTEGDCYNREHIIPQSIFNEGSPMVADAHFITPTDGKVNGMRSNYPHGMVGTATYTSKNGSKLGSALNSGYSAGYSGTVFEPINEFKGDIARMYFYFATRYENVITTWGTSYAMFNGTTNQVFAEPFLTILLTWNAQDPVSASEIARNNAIYTRQHNRNPFIDHPEYVNQIWGSTSTDTQAPTAPTSLAASSVAQTTLTLGWTASTDNVAVTGYNIYKNGTLLTTVTTTSYSATGLTAATAYTFYVKAKDAAGNVSAASTILSVTTASATDTQAPTAPTNLAASSVAQTTLTLGWTASTDNVAVTGYDIYKNGTLLTTVTTTSYSVTGLTAATAYTFYVKAKDAAGNVSAASTTINVTTASTTVSYCTSKGNSVADEWISKVVIGAFTNTSTAAGYTDFTSKTITLTAGAAASITLTPGFSGSSYSEYWRIWIDYNGDKDFDETNELAFDAGSASSTAKTGTINVISSASGSTRMRVSMKYNAAPTACEAFSYGSVQDFTVKFSTSTDTQAPTAPTNLAASSIAQTTLTLGWTASTDNVAVTGYDIYKNGTLLTTVTTTSYNVTGLTAATAYTFYVKAKDAAGNVSVASSTVSTTTLAAADTQVPTAPTSLSASSIAQTTLTLGWTASTDNVGVTGYDVYKNGTLLTSVTTTTYSVTGLTAGTTYTFYVKAKDAAGNVSAASSTISATTTAATDTQAPTSPTSLTLSNITQTSATLTWSASTDNVGVTGYKVYKNGTLLGTTTSTTYSFTGLTAATTYTLAVAAFDASSNVSSQATTSLTTLAAATTKTETFANFSASSSYVTGTFTGQDGSTWSYNGARGDIAITGSAPTLGKGRSPLSYVLSGTIQGGIGTLKFDYMQAFSTSVNLYVYVNSTLVKTINTGTVNVVSNSGTITVNVSGAFTIKFVQANTSAGQIAIDNIVWTTYTGASAMPKENSMVEFKVFPNPVTDVLTITSNNSSNNQYALIDMLGKTIERGVFSNALHLNVSTLNKGMYFIRFVDDKGKPHTERFLKK